MYNVIFHNLEIIFQACIYLSVNIISWKNVKERKVNNALKD